MNRYTRAATALVLGIVLVQIGNAVGATAGGLIIALGGVAMLYALFELFRRRF